MASYFARLGFHIYHPLNSGSWFDFILVRGMERLAIQVKTATWQPRGRCYSVKIDARKYRASCPFDVLACVGPRGEIWLVPASVAMHRQTIRFRPGQMYAGLNSDDWRVQ